MDTKWMIENRLELANNSLYFPGQCPAVGVTQNHRFRAAADGGPECLQCIGGVRFITVEEMFSIIDHALVIGFEINNRLLDDSEIIFEGCEQYFFDVQSPGLAKDRADRGLRIEQCFDVGIAFGSAFDAASRAERGDESILPLHIPGTLEEFNILWI